MPKATVFAKARKIFANIAAEKNNASDLDTKLHHNDYTYHETSSIQFLHLLV